MKKNILITGGGGFIGTNLNTALLKRGHNVVVSDIYNSHQENFYRCDVKYLRQIQDLRGSDHTFQISTFGAEF